MRKSRLADRIYVTFVILVGTWSLYRYYTFCFSDCISSLTARSLIITTTTTQYTIEGIGNIGNIILPPSPQVDGSPTSEASSSGSTSGVMKSSTRQLDNRSPKVIRAELRAAADDKKAAKKVKNSATSYGTEVVDGSTEADQRPALSKKEQKAIAELAAAAAAVAGRGGNNKANAPPVVVGDAYILSSDKDTLVLNDAEVARQLPSPKKDVSFDADADEAAAEDGGSGSPSSIPRRRKKSTTRRTTVKRLTIRDRFTPIVIRDLIWLLASLFCTFMMVWSYYMITTTDPGVVPKCFSVYAQKASRMALSTGGTLSKCAICHIFKPPRCHHCSKCGRCVLKYDHHCVWVGQCIGYFNYKVFFNFCFWTCIFTNVASISLSRSVYLFFLHLIARVTEGQSTALYSLTETTTVYIRDSPVMGSTEVTDAPITADIILLFFIFFIAGSISWYSLKKHYYLARDNKTTVEEIILDGDPSPYSLSREHNWEEVFGDRNARYKHNSIIRWIRRMVPTLAYGRQRQSEIDSEEYFSLIREEKRRQRLIKEYRSLGGLVGVIGTGNGALAGGYGATLTTAATATPLTTAAGTDSQQRKSKKASGGSARPSSETEPSTKDELMRKIGKKRSVSKRYDDDEQRVDAGQQGLSPSSPSPSTLPPDAAGVGVGVGGGDSTISKKKRKKSKRTETAETALPVTTESKSYGEEMTTIANMSDTANPSATASPLGSDQLQLTGEGKQQIMSPASENDTNEAVAEEKEEEEEVSSNETLSQPSSSNTDDEEKQTIKDQKRIANMKKLQRRVRRRDRLLRTDSPQLPFSSSRRKSSRPFSTAHRSDEEDDDDEDDDEMGKTPFNPPHTPPDRDLKLFSSSSSSSEEKRRRLRLDGNGDADEDDETFFSRKSPLEPSYHKHGVRSYYRNPLEEEVHSDGVEDDHGGEKDDYRRDDNNEEDKKQGGRIDHLVEKEKKYATDTSEPADAEAVEGKAKRKENENDIEDENDRSQEGLLTKSKRKAQYRPSSTSKSQQRKKATRQRGDSTRSASNTANKSPHLLVETGRSPSNSTAGTTFSSNILTAANGGNSNNGSFDHEMLRVEHDLVLDDGSGDLGGGERGGGGGAFIVGGGSGLAIVGPNANASAVSASIGPLVPCAVHVVELCPQGTHFAKHVPDTSSSSSSPSSASSSRSSSSDRSPNCVVSTAQDGRDAARATKTSSSSSWWSPRGLRSSSATTNSSDLKEKKSKRSEKDADTKARSAVITVGSGSEKESKRRSGDESTAIAARYERLSMRKTATRFRKAGGGHAVVTINEEPSIIGNSSEGEDEKSELVPAPSVHEDEPRKVKSQQKHSTSDRKGNGKGSKHKKR